MAINNTSDVISQIQARSKPGVTFTVSAVPGGNYAVYRNNVLLYRFHLVTHPSFGTQVTVKSGTGTDANPSGAQLTLVDNNGVSAKADAAQFIASLK